MVMNKEDHDDDQMNKEDHLMQVLLFYAERQTKVYALEDTLSK